jgi:hypothetical protein
MKDLREAVVLIASMNGTSEKLVNGGWCQQLPEVDRLHEKSTSRHLADLISEWKNLRIQLLVLPAWSLLAFVLFGQAYLLPIFFESLSMSTEKEYWMLLLFQGLDVAGLLVLISTIDRPGIGRQKSIAGSAILCAISALLASFFWLQQGFCVLFVFMVLMKISAIMAFEGMYVYAAELVPTSHRQSALSLGVGLSKAASGFIGMLLSPLMNVQTAQSLTPETGKTNQSLHGCLNIIALFKPSTRSWLVFELSDSCNMVQWTKARRTWCFRWQQSLLPCSHQWVPKCRPTNS